MAECSRRRLFRRFLRAWRCQRQCRDQWQGRLLSIAQLGRASTAIRMLLVGDGHADFTGFLIYRDAHNLYQVNRVPLCVSDGVACIIRRTIERSPLEFGAIEGRLAIHKLGECLLNNVLCNLPGLHLRHWASADRGLLRHCTPREYLHTDHPHHYNYYR